MAPIRELQPAYKYGKSWKQRELSPSSPSSRRRFPKGWREFVKQYWPYAVGLISLGIIAIIAVFAWYSRDLPDPDRLLDRAVAQSTRIYDRTGENILYELHGDERRTIVNLEDIPDYLEHATVAIEDKHFYTHKGFSFAGFLRAVWINVTSLGRERPGGSTITQQFIKNAVLTSEKKITRKIKELVLSYQLERKFSKDQILKLYLNEIPYGSNAYGVESASQTYFGKSVRDLSLAESAVIAALPQAPTYYSPFGSHVDDLIGRQHYVLGIMVEQGYITKEEAEAAKTEELYFQTARTESITAPHFVFYVKELLTEKYGELAIETGGLRVITSLDLHAQETAEQAIQDGMAKVEQYGGSNAALVALDTKSGDILAMVGSRDYFDTEHDGNVNVAIRNRQPGSSFKPFAYAAAFEKGYTPETMLFDVTTNFGGNPAYIPRNYDGVTRGPVSMRKALAGSLNIPAVKTLYLAGVNTVVDLARSLGYTTIDDPNRYGLSLVLGGAEVKLLEHTSAFATLSREGIRHEPRAILRVEDSDGQILEENDVSKNRVMDEVVARNVNSILSDNGARAYVFGGANYLTLSDRPVAAKTGTTNDYRDAWTLGYTPSLAAGVWVGNNDNTEMRGGAAGAVVAAPIWHGFMNQNLSGTPVETFKAPPANDTDKLFLNGQIDEVTILPVDQLTGKVIPVECRDTYPASFVEERQFKQTHTILQYVDRNNPRKDIPSDPGSDPQYLSWELAVQGWADQQPGYIRSLNDLAHEDCSLREGTAVSVALTNPTDGATITGDTLITSVRVASAQGIDRVEYFLDNQLIDRYTDEPYVLSYSIASLPNGFYTLRAKAIDLKGNIAQDSATINILHFNAAESIYFTGPEEGASIGVSDFPIDVSYFAYDPDGVASVTLTRSSKKGGGTIGIVESPAASAGSISWESAPAVGAYTLTLAVEDANDDTVSVERSVTITK